MASHRASGVVHFSRSTPAVRLPWFIVTRRTANALAENERVRDRCRAFTLRQSPSCVAFAIRICISRTFRSTRRQSMAPQVCGPPESADSSLRINASMLLSNLEDLPQHQETARPLRGVLPLKGRKFKQARSVSRPATIDQLEVCPLSRGMMSQPLSGPLQPGIRFFQHPIPAQPTAFLAVRLPEPNCAPAAIRAYHVPCALHDWVRVCLSAGGHRGDVSQGLSRTTDHTPFG